MTVRAYNSRTKSKSCVRESTRRRRRPVCVCCSCRWRAADRCVPKRAAVCTDINSLTSPAFLYPLIIVKAFRYNGVLLLSLSYALLLLVFSPRAVWVKGYRTSSFIRARNCGAKKTLFEVEKRSTSIASIRFTFNISIYIRIYHNCAGQCWVSCFYV